MSSLTTPRGLTSPIALFALLSVAAVVPGCAADAGETTSSTESAYTTRAPVNSNVASFKSLDANVAYALDTSGDLWRDSLSSAEHTRIDGSVKAFQPIAGDYYVYVLGENGNLWFEPNGTAGRSLVAPGVQAFQATGIGFVYWKDASNNLWYQVDTAPPTLVDSSVNDFYVIDNSAIYVLGTDANLWNENGSASNRSLVQPDVLTYFPVDSSHVYVEDTTATLWNENGSWNNRFPVDSSVLRYYPIDASSVLVEGGDGNLWREVHDYKFRDFVDGNVQALQPSGATAAWVLGDNGNLWLEQMGTPPIVLSGSTSNGWSNVGFWPNGNWVIEASIENNNLFSATGIIEFQVMANSTGQVFVFSGSWGIGSYSTGMNLAATGDNPALVTAFPAIAAGYTWNMKLGLNY